MVALRKNKNPRSAAAPSPTTVKAGVGATNIVRRAPKSDGPLVDARSARRVRVAQRAWLCGSDGSVRGYALDLSLEGGRFGGAGTRLPVGAGVIVKLILDEREAPLLIRAQVVRYAPALHCPELCLQFIEFPDEATRTALRTFLER